MGWLGKVVGGTIGFALGGPLGAVAGAAFGHAFDSSEEKQITHNRTRLGSVEESQLTFFVAAFSMLAKLVKADGQVRNEEIDSIQKFMVYDLKLDPESQRIAMNIFRAALDSPGSFKEFATQFYHQFRQQYQILEMMIDILVRVSVADGHFGKSEENLILSAVSIFNFGEEKYHIIKSKYIRDIDKFYAILKVDKNHSAADIKKQYRKLVQEYHPDKIASKGLPDEFNQFAHDKFREIQEAYDTIKKERGFN